MNTVYLISGPLGVGKTTVTRALHKTLSDSVLIEGDMFLHALAGRDELPWEKKLELSWQEILAHTKEGVQENHVVVIDFVVEEELPWFYK